MRDIDEAIVTEAIAFINLLDGSAANGDLPEHTRDLRVLVRAREILCRKVAPPDPLAIPVFLERSE